MKVSMPAVLIPAAAVALYLFVPGARERPWTATRVFGLALAVAGYALAVAARIQLGNSFTVMPQARELVTRGFYSRLRNPLYVFVDAMLAGLILFFGAPWLFLVLAAVVALQSIQARREARVLEAAFGERYREYCKRTWF